MSLECRYCYEWKLEQACKRVAACIVYYGSVRKGLEFAPGWEPKDPSAAVLWYVEHKGAVAEQVQLYADSLVGGAGDAAFALIDRLVGYVRDAGSGPVNLASKDLVGGETAGGAAAEGDMVTRMIEMVRGEL